MMSIDNIIANQRPWYEVLECDPSADAVQIDNAYTAALRKQRAQPAHLLEKEIYWIERAYFQGLRALRVKGNFEQIDRATPHLDKFWNGKDWKPSELLLIAYCIMATGPNGDDPAERFLVNALNAARSLYREGKDPNPFGPDSKLDLTDFANIVGLIDTSARKFIRQAQAWSNSAMGARND